MNYLESYLKFVTARPSLRCDAVDPQDYECCNTESPPSNIPELENCAEECGVSNQELLEVEVASELEPQAVAAILNASTDSEDDKQLELSLSQNSENSTEAPLHPSNQEVQITLPWRKSHKLLKCNTCRFKTRDKLCLKKHYKEIHELILVKKTGLSDRINGQCDVDICIPGPPTLCIDPKERFHGLALCIKKTNPHLMVKQDNKLRDEKLLDLNMDATSDLTSVAYENVFNIVLEELDVPKEQVTGSV